MNHPLGPAAFFALRGLERLSSVPSLFWALKPFALAQVAMERSAPLPALPGCLGPSNSVRETRHDRARFHLNRAVEFFPDRLASAKWRGRCRVTGLEHLQQARADGRPVVLAFLHSGPFFLIRPWLRAHAIPAMSLVAGTAALRSRVKRLKDQAAPLPEVPSVLHVDQLREVVAALASGAVLMIALDQPTGRQVFVPLGEGWTFRMATGAIRLAARGQAELLPCAIIDEGEWRFGMEIGPPVPREFLAEPPDLARAAAALLEELLPGLQRHPEQCCAEVLDCFQRSVPVPAPESSLA